MRTVPWSTPPLEDQAVSAERRPDSMGLGARHGCDSLKPSTDTWWLEMPAAKLDDIVA